MITVRETYVTMDDGVKLYTRIILPEEGKRLPIVFIRTPYDPARKGNKCLPAEFTDNQFIKGGYAIVAQHVRGSGDSEGDFSPYSKRERDDGLLTLEFIRTLDIYNGEIYLCGMSYLTQVHYAYLDTEPEDIKGAVLCIQTDDMYRRNFRNGNCYKFSNLPWWELVFKRKYPKITSENVIRRPYKDIARRMTGGEDIPILTDMLTHDKEDDFWASIPLLDAPRHIHFPVLYIEGWFDYYSEGMFAAWEKLPEKTREQSAMLVLPVGHATCLNGQAQYPLNNGNPPQDYAVRWFESIRNKTEYPYAKNNRLTYYNIGTDSWETEEFFKNSRPLRLYINADRTLGKKGAQGCISYRYDPQRLHNFFKYDNIFKHPAAKEEDGIISFYSDEFSKDTSFLGAIGWNMTVSSDCEDTCFFMRVYLTEGNESYNLTEAITTLSHIDPNYRPDSEISISIKTSPIGFTAKKGSRIRIDISSDSTAWAPHANVKGNWAFVTKTKIACNTLICKDAYIELPQKDY